MLLHKPPLKYPTTPPLMQNPKLVRLVRVYIDNYFESIKDVNMESIKKHHLEALSKINQDQWYLN